MPFISPFGPGLIIPIESIVSPTPIKKEDVSSMGELEKKLLKHIDERFTEIDSKIKSIKSVDKTSAIDYSALEEKIKASIKGEIKDYLCSDCVKKGDYALDKVAIEKLINDKFNTLSASLKLYVESFNAALEHLAAENASLQLEHAAMKTEHAEMKAAQTEMKAAQTEIKKDNAEIKREHAEIKTEHSAMKTEHSAMKTEHSAMKTEHTDMRRENATSQRELERRIAVLESSSTRVQQRIDTENAALQERLNQFEATISAQVAQKLAVPAQNINIDTELASLRRTYESEIARLKTEALAAIQSSKDDALATLGREKDILIRNIKTAAASPSGPITTNIDYSQQIAELNRIYATQTAAINELQALSQDNASRIETFNTKIRDLESLKQTSQDNAANIVELKEANEAQKTINADFFRKFSDLGIRLDRIIVDMNRRFDDIQKIASQKIKEQRDAQKEKEQTIAQKSRERQSKLEKELNETNNDELRRTISRKISELEQKYDGELAKIRKETADNLSAEKISIMAAFDRNADEKIARLQAKIDSIKLPEDNSAALNQRITDIQRTHDDQMKQLSEKYDRSIDEIKKTHAEILSKVSQIPQLSKSINDIKTGLDGYKRGIDTRITAVLAQVKQNDTSVNQRIDTLEGRINSSSSDSMREYIAQQISVLKEQYSLDNQKLSQDLKRQIEEIKSESASLLSTYDDKVKQIAQAEIAAKKAELDIKFAQLRNSIMAEIQSKKQSGISPEQLRTEFNAKIGKLKVGYEQELKEIISRYGRESTKLNTDIEELKRQLAELLTKIDERIALKISAQQDAANARLSKILPTSLTAEQRARQQLLSKAALEQGKSIREKAAERAEAANKAMRERLDSEQLAARNAAIANEAKRTERLKVLDAAREAERNRILQKAKAAAEARADAEAKAAAAADAEAKAKADADAKAAAERKLQAEQRLQQAREEEERRLNRIKREKEEAEAAKAAEKAKKDAEEKEAAERYEKQRQERIAAAAAKRAQEEADKKAEQDRQAAEAEAKATAERARIAAEEEAARKHEYIMGAQKRLEAAQAEIKRQQEAEAAEAARKKEIHEQALREIEAEREATRNKKAEAEAKAKAEAQAKADAQKKAAADAKAQAAALLASRKPLYESTEGTLSDEELRRRIHDAKTSVQEKKNLLAEEVRRRLKILKEASKRAKGNETAEEVLLREEQERKNKRRAYQGQMRKNKYIHDSLDYLLTDTPFY